MKSRAVGVVTVGLALLCAGGCQSSKALVVSPAGPSTSIESSAQPAPSQAPVVPAVSTGPITTPAQGTPVRKALMDAARRGLSTSSQFIVHQLHVQGTVALADLEPASGGMRRLLGFVRQSEGGWRLVFFDAGQARAEAIHGAIPQASAELLAKLDLTTPAPSSASVADEPAPVGDYNRAFIQSWSPKGDAPGGGTTTVRIHFVSDDTGDEKTVEYVTDNSATDFEVSHSKFDITSGYESVSRNQFFDAVSAGALPNVSSNVKAVWRRGSDGGKYLFLTTLRASFAAAG